MKIKKICILLLILIICMITIPIVGCASNTVEFNKRIRSVIKYNEVWVLTSSLSSHYFIIRGNERLEDIRIFFNDVQFIKLSKVDENEKVTEEFMQLKESAIFMMEISFKQVTEDRVVIYSIYVDSETGYVYDLCLTENDKEQGCSLFEMNHYYKSIVPIDLMEFKNIFKEGC